MFGFQSKNKAGALFTALFTAQLAALFAIAPAQPANPPGPAPAGQGPGGPGSAAGEGPGGDPLPELLAEARRNNPSLKSARLDAEVDREEGRGGTALRPPEAGVEFYHAPLASFPNPVKDQVEIDYFLQQSLPFPGKRGAAGRPALRRAEAAEARAKAMEIGIAREVKEAYLELYRLDALRRINGDNQGLVRRFVEIARKQYELGLGGQGDILRAHAELASLSNDAVGLLENRESALGRLNALLDRAPDSSFTPPANLRPRSANLPFDRVLALAQARHPALAALDADVRVREAEAAAAGKEYLPDLMVRGTYKDVREPPIHGGKAEDGWAVMVGMDMPFAFWSAPRYRAGYRTAGILAEKARLERRAGSNRLAAEIRTAMARMRAAAEMLDLARSAMLPHADQALQSIQSSYTSGKASFMDLMDAYRMSIEAREDELAAVVKVVGSRADLESAVGMDMDGIAQAIGGGGAPSGAQGGRP